MRLPALDYCSLLTFEVESYAAACPVPESIPWEFVFTLADVQDLELRREVWHRLGLASALRRKAHDEARAAQQPRPPREAR